MHGDIIKYTVPDDSHPSYIASVSPAHIQFPIFTHAIPYNYTGCQCSRGYST